MGDISEKLQAPSGQVADLNERARAVFREIVDTYLETGVPAGSRLISSRLPFKLSPASIRSLMSELETMGLLYAPHISAGRLPTQAGLRFFVDAMLEVGGLSTSERAAIETRVRGHNRTVEEVLTEASTLLSGLSHCAGLVAVSKSETALKHIEFVPLEPGRCLVILVTEEGRVENRVMEIPSEMTPSTLRQATNYLNARVAGRTIEEAALLVREEIALNKAELDLLARGLVEAGLANWAGEEGRPDSRVLIVRGQANLLENLTAHEDVERIRRLFDDLESKEALLRLLDFAKDADGVRIFIGAETKLFSLSGSSLVISPYMDAEERMVGVLGIIGPTRLNYARIIPMVDYTAKMVSRLLR
jgi:heat-inducible transcriptional repressor